jgi:L-threonylcarbamoyladenylate synthase
MITSGLPNVALRAPDHEVALQVLRAAGPFAAPSANKFGRTSPTRAEHVQEEFSIENLGVVDGGDCRVGIESTIVQLKTGPDRDKPTYEVTEWSILRPGAITASMIEETLAADLIPNRRVAAPAKIVAPGQMEQHYQPRIPLYLFVKDAAGELTIEDRGHALKSIPAHLTASVREMVLSPAAPLAARELYARMRSTAEMAGATAMYFILTENHQDETWDGIRNRLQRAATKTIFLR